MPSDDETPLNRRYMLEMAILHEMDQTLIDQFLAAQKSDKLSDVTYLVEASERNPELKRLLMEYQDYIEADAK